MSYTNIDILPNLINKKVLFFDLETTGLVKNKNSKEPQEFRYPSYKSNEDYDSSRIVQIGYIKFDDFDYDIVKPDGFIIPDNVIKIHGITNEHANEEGIEIKKVMKKMKKVIEDVDYIIGYNVYFDVNVLMNELYRAGHKSTVNRINEIKKNKNILCVGELAKQYKCYKDSSMPCQVNIYKELFGEELVNAHNAVHDILATIRIFYWFNDNVNKFIEGKNRKENNNKKWDINDYDKLIINVKNKQSVKEIALFHKRSVGSIRSAIYRLVKNDKIEQEDMLEEYVLNLEKYK